MPRRPEQFEEIREKSREKILSASLELFANKGYDATSIDSIAKKAGISKGLIYNYYESKKAILLAIFEDVMKQGEIIFAKRKKVADVNKRMEGIVHDVFDMLEQNPEYMKLLMVLSLQPGVMNDTQDFTKEMFKKNQEWVGSIYSKNGKKDIMGGLIFDALIDGILLNYVRYGNKYPLAALKERIIKDFCTPEKRAKKSSSLK